MNRGEIRSWARELTRRMADAHDHCRARLPAGTVHVLDHVEDRIQKIVLFCRAPRRVPWGRPFTDYCPGMPWAIVLLPPDLWRRGFVHVHELVHLLRIHDTHERGHTGTYHLARRIEGEDVHLLLFLVCQVPHDLLVSRDLWRGFPRWKHHVLAEHRENLFIGGRLLERLGQRASPLLRGYAIVHHLARAWGERFYGLAREPFGGFRAERKTAERLLERIEELEGKGDLDDYTLTREVIRAASLRPLVTGFRPLDSTTDAHFLDSFSRLDAYLRCCD